MAITLLSALIIIAAYFLILYAGVAFIQDKRFFSSAPKENLDAIPDKKERFRGAHVIGWIIGILAILMFAGAFVLAAWDGVKNGFGYGLWPVLRAVHCDTTVAHEQKRCLPMVTISGWDQIHLLVAVAGLK